MRQFCINNHCRQAGAMNTAKNGFFQADARTVTF